MGLQNHRNSNFLLQLPDLFHNFPQLFSSLYTSYGPQSAWLIELTVVSSTLALWLVLYRRMVPLEGPELPAPAATVPDDHPEDAEPDKQMPSGSGAGSGRRRMRSSRREERKPLVEPIDEEDPEAAERLNRNDATVSTVASLREAD